MATFQDGNRRRATANSVTAARRSAESRQCPKCGRKSALVFFSEDWGYGHICRWRNEGKCDYENISVRVVQPDDEPTHTAAVQASRGAL